MHLCVCRPGILSGLTCFQLTLCSLFIWISEWQWQVPPGFNLRRSTWSMLNRFRFGQGRSVAISEPPQTLHDIIELMSIWHSLWSHALYQVWWPHPAPLCWWQCCREAAECCSEGTRIVIIVYRLTTDHDAWLIHKYNLQTNKLWDQKIDKIVFQLTHSRS